MILTQIFLSFFSTLLGALCFRIRGGAFGDFIRRKIYSGYGATTSRLVVWSLPMTLMFFLAQPFHSWWVYPLAFVLLYLGTIVGWWKSLDLGRREGKWIIDFIAHTARGVLWVLPLAILCFYLGSYTTFAALLVAGLLCGVLYELGYRVKLPEKLRNSSLELGPGPGLGEFFFGALIGLAITL